MIFGSTDPAPPAVSPILPSPPISCDTAQAKGIEVNNRSYSLTENIPLSAADVALPIRVRLLMERSPEDCLGDLTELDWDPSATVAGVLPLVSLDVLAIEYAAQFEVPAGAQSVFLVIRGTFKSGKKNHTISSAIVLIVEGEN